MTRTAPALAAAFLMFLAACGTTRDPCRPAAIEQLDIVHKEKYILTIKATLKNFRAAAGDLYSRDRPAALLELATRFDRYVVLQVDPILRDPEAQNSLDTRMELAKIELLCALTHLELREYEKAKVRLEGLEEKYGDHPEIFETPIDRDDIGVTNLDGGLKLLRAKMAAGRGRRMAAAQSPSLRNDRLRGEK